MRGQLSGSNEAPGFSAVKKEGTITMKEQQLQEICER